MTGLFLHLLLHLRQHGFGLLQAAAHHGLQHRGLHTCILRPHFGRNTFGLLGKSGLHLNHGNNLGGDIVLFDKNVLSPDHVNAKFASVSPQIVFEIDIKIDLENMTEYAYIHKKTQKLLDFGVKKVFWITSSTKKIMLAVPNEDWRIIDWDKDIEIEDGVFFNVGKYLEERGIDVSVADSNA